MNNPPEISILICTWNRSFELKETLESLNRQTLAPERFEVVVVDNNSTDDTAEVVAPAAAQAAHPVIYVMERQQGKSRALNAGIAATRAPIIACTDDDCRPEPDWAEVVLRAFDNPDIGLLGGPGLSVFPDAVRADAFRLFLGRRFLGDFAPYDQLTELHERNLPLGLNLSFRREIAGRVGGFDVTLGPTGKRHLCREETAFVRGAQALGYRVFFHPGAVVHHHLGQDRICWKAIRKQGYESGIGHYRERWARRVGSSIPKKAALTALFSLEYAYSCLRMLLFTFRPKRRIVARFRAVATAGKIAGVWQKQ